jgi:hypothetical protein
MARLSLSRFFSHIYIRQQNYSPPTQYVFSKITVDGCLRINRIVNSRLDSQLRICFTLINK